MMGSQPELSALKDIPGYKAILKTVLKSQIQLLLEQLAENTGEESIILTASINDGSLSHLGSSMGKNFLDGREEIKSQFLGFCLKGHQQMRQDEDRNQMFGRSNISNMPQYGTRRPRIRPHPYSVSSPHSQSSSNNRSNLQDFSSATPPFLKTEDSSVNSADNFLDSVSSDMQEDQMGLQASVSLNHTQPSSQDRKNELNQSGLSSDKEHQSRSSDIPIKIEPVSDDLEDEVRIIESEENSASSETWGQGDPNETDQSRFRSTCALTSCQKPSSPGQKPLVPDQPYSSVLECEPFTDIPYPHRLTIEELINIQQTSQSVGHYAINLTRRLFPELFGPDCLRKKYSYREDVNGKMELDVRRKVYLQRYILYVNPEVDNRKAWQRNVIAPINELLRRPGNQGRKSWKCAGKTQI